MVRILILLSALSWVGCSSTGGEATHATGSDAVDIQGGDPIEDIVEMEDAPWPDVSEPSEGREPDGGLTGDASDALPDVPSPRADAEEAGAKWGADQCPATPEGAAKGFAIGDQLDVLGFSRCDESAFALDSTCGASATWIFIAHAWCGECQTVASFSDEVAAYFEDHNVAIVHVLAHSPAKELPLSQDCVDWETLWGFENTTLVYDPWFASVFRADSGQTVQSVILDADRMIVEKLHTDDQAQILGAIQQALSP